MNLMQLLVKSKETLGGRYKLIQPLSQGGFGHTFIATDLHLPDHPTCVIKQLKPHLQDSGSLQVARRLFETEARVLYQLGEHTQIPRLLAHFEDGQEFYLAQELIEGNSLSDLIRPGQPWSEARVRQLLSEILTPLTFVHEQGVIHRDLKPSNLIHRRADDHIVLIDFGAVKQVSERRYNGPATRTISIGTQGYMPSEQLAGNPWFSSDIYAAGMICLQALTGTAPHLIKRDPHTSEVVWQSPDLDISADFKSILARMVHYDFRDRYPTAAAALAELQALPEITNEALVAPSKIDIPIQTPTQPLDIRKLGTPVSSPSLQPATKTTATALSTLLLSKPGRWSILGVSILMVAALGLFRTSQTSANLAFQTPETPQVETAPSSPVAAPSSPVAAETPAAEKPSTAETPTAQPSTAQTPATDQTLPTSVPEDNAVKAAVDATPPPPSSPVSATTTSPAAAAPAAAKPSAKPFLNELLTKAKELRDRNQYSDALQVYDQLLEHYPDQAEAHWGQCYSWNHLQNYGQAVAACDRALAIAPDHIQSLLSKGYALEQQRQPDAALALYDQVLSLAPDYTDAWNNRGGIMFRQQRFEEALAAFERARDIDPNFAEAWNNRGAALWELRRFDDAIASIDQAIALQPDYPEAQDLRAQIRQKLGR
ncbi:MAG: tetratricopeptide repeat protein [Cyanobacteria bacterium P01_B01_bin.77]